MRSRFLFSAVLLAPLLLATACQRAAPVTTETSPQTAAAESVSAPSAESGSPQAPAESTSPAAGMRAAHGAPAPAQASKIEAEVVAEGLQVPWALAFLPDGRMLVTERGGQLRYIGADGAVSAPITGVPQVHAQGQGGLLDVALSPQFAQDALVYLSYAEAGDDGLAGTTLGRGRLIGDRIEGWEVLFRQMPRLSKGGHFGSRIVFDRDGYLFLALGENNQRPTSQLLDHLQGKLVRLYPDGTVPDDNPFVGRDDARAEIWSYGHRNQQGAALHPDSGALWTSEHGPRGGDELNIPQAGANYGWPLATYGINYSGQPIPESVGTWAPGTEPPHYYFERSPGLSGMAFYRHERFPEWNHSLFLGGLASADLIRLELDGDRIVAEERLLTDLRPRVRDVRQGPDGFVYVLSETDGRLLRIGLAR
ncbi:PQQ-dependent sugar dehydrogenase [Denitratimonas sp. CY0512]|uniref:PQQ-dependent sugar dehydrogenase n=1 Tax=Denitratimonas sp. CY0512 TaxID=3131940 RepID=UPI0030B00756